MNRPLLDGQPLNTKRVALEHGWPVKLGARAMAGPDAPTTLQQLRAWIVSYRSVPHGTKHQPGRGARRWNNCTAELPLNKPSTAGKPSG